MSKQSLIAEASTRIHAPVDRVWEALIDPKQIKQYMFGTTAASDWKVGSPITFKGEWEGRPYEDKGKILELVPGKRLRYSHFSPSSGQPDRPENYHTVTIDLRGDGPQTHVTLSQDNNATEEAKQHSEKNWSMMLASLKKLLEQA